MYYSTYLIEQKQSKERLGNFISTIVKSKLLHLHMVCTQAHTLETYFLNNQFISLTFVFIIGNKMYHMFDYDHELIDEYIPMPSLEPNTPSSHIKSFRSLESRFFHEGRIVESSFLDHDYITSMFRVIEFDCLFHINESICPRFVLEFYRQVKLIYNENQTLSL